MAHCVQQLYNYVSYKYAVVCSMHADNYGAYIYKVTLGTYNNYALSDSHINNTTMIIILHNHKHDYLYIVQLLVSI